jgi:hypothetical protein
VQSQLVRMRSQPSICTPSNVSPVTHARRSPARSRFPWFRSVTLGGPAGEGTCTDSEGAAPAKKVAAASAATSEKRTRLASTWPFPDVNGDGRLDLLLPRACQPLSRPRRKRQTHPRPLRQGLSGDHLLLTLRCQEHKLGSRRSGGGLVSRRSRPVALLPARHPREELVAVVAPLGARPIPSPGPGSALRPRAPRPRHKRFHALRERARRRAAAARPTRRSRSQTNVPHVVARDTWYAGATISEMPSSTEREGRVQARGAAANHPQVVAVGLPRLRG